MRSKSKQADEPDREDLEPAEQLARRLLGLKLATLRVNRREIAEIQRILDCDYDALPALPSPAATRTLAELVASEFHPLHEFWMRRGQARLRLSQPAQCCREIALRAAPYRSGAGLGLWGFSCAMRGEGQGTFVIYLNTAHQPGAVALTAAHELGHYFTHATYSEGTHPGFAPMAANFTAHLEDASELFSDSAAALAAFSPRAAEAIADARGLAVDDLAALAQRVADPRLRIDVASTAINPRWRLRYLAASIHFMKLRLVLHRIAGV